VAHLLARVRAEKKLGKLKDDGEGKEKAGVKRPRVGPGEGGLEDEGGGGGGDCDEKSVDCRPERKDVEEGEEASLGTRTGFSSVP